MPMNYSVDQGQKYGQRVGLINDPNYDFVVRVFLGFSSWKNSCSAQQMLFHCEYMKLIGELLTM